MGENEAEALISACIEDAILRFGHEHTVAAARRILDKLDRTGLPVDRDEGMSETLCDGPL